MIDACKASTICLFFSSVIFRTILSQISWSDITPNARNTMNNGIGILMRGICKQIG